MQVNYPNDHDFTRIVEIRHATYRCYNMDQVVGMALSKFDRLQKQFVK
jgi:UDP-galactopyranose mutase